MSRPDLSLKARLLLIFAAFALLCLVIAGVGVYGIQATNNRALVSYRQITLPGQYLQTSYGTTLVEDIQLMESMQLTDPNARKERFELIERLQQSSDDQFALFSQSPKVDAIRPLAEELVRNRAALADAFGKSMALFREGNTAAAIDLESTTVRSAGMVYSANVDKFTRLLQSATKAGHEADLAAYRRTMVLILTIFVIGSLATGLYGWVQIRSIDRSVGQFQNTLLEVSETLDLTRRVPVMRMDEIGRTAIAFNGLTERLGGVLGLVVGSVDSVTTASREISSGNLDLSARTEEQAASLEQTAASMTQLTGTVRQNATNAREAATVAGAASALADSGYVAVDTMLKTIEDIRESSTKISDITGMIEGIAFQTNILALNAAVEAARAGDQGRGFAVVASEVRSLAQRSAAAAKEIKLLIEASVALVENGSAKATHVGGIVGDIRQAINRVSAIVGEISAASDEQSRGIDQVGRAVVQMDQVTQQNAALVEEAAAAAQSLEAQAGKMKEAAAAFRI
ncbi:methyl-accepting chemotaxis protein [Paraburkholderia sp. J63]|uniref:methyl-accepting chemotaxis protein n=1 Tax=Paraburkholderia sp. J63 TaxID=2805434 RepID=UPI002ABE4D58|nr:methyl-accepting chemotaxis protein [Paraburkholderia sp. J63]